MMVAAGNCVMKSAIVAESFVVKVIEIVLSGRGAVAVLLVCGVDCKVTS